MIDWFIYGGLLGAIGLMGWYLHNAWRTEDLLRDQLARQRMENWSLEARLARLQEVIDQVETYERKKQHDRCRSPQ